jgi:RHS repeat-associated protein
VGNRLTQVLSPGAVTDSYAYPALSNRLGTITLGAGGTRTFTYDAAGNVTYDNRNGQGYGYTYDQAGRMVSFAINGIVQAEYAYNHLGQQIIRRLTQAGTTIQSVYGPDGNRIAEYNEATGALIRQYVWLNGAPIAVIEGAVISYVRADHIGRPAFATNATGTVVWSAAYLPFGGVRVTTGTPITARFPGQWFQAENGLHQNWMRDYDPTTGRYLQADPLGLIDGASVYGYARQSPLRWTDPRGEQSTTTTGGFDALSWAEWVCRRNPACSLGNFVGKVCIAGVQLWMHSGAGMESAPIASSGDDGSMSDENCDNCCEEEREALRRAKDNMYGVGACSNDDSWQTLQYKLSLWAELLQARRNAAACFNDGDPTHRDQIRYAERMVENCQRRFP